jgi:hypothetical protein
MMDKKKTNGTGAGDAWGKWTMAACTMATQRSQHEVRALASMVLASLPFPPLPVMVLQGEDNADGLASSYDLLQTAVMNSTLGMQVKGKDAQAIARSKQATLERLLHNMKALYTSSFGADFPVWQAYEIFCDAFREYLLEHYATGSRDLRFYPMDTVAADSLLVGQGSSHWNAGRMLAGEPEIGERFCSYPELISAYALDLATLQE